MIILKLTSKSGAWLIIALAYLLLSISSLAEISQGEESFNEDSLLSFSSTSNDDINLNLRLAREHRFGIGDDASISVEKSFNYYAEALKLGTQTQQQHPISTEAIYEFSELLEDLELTNQQGSITTKNIKYSSLDLIVEAAHRGHSEAQLKLAAIYGTGIHTGGLVPMDAGRSLMNGIMSSLAGNNPEANMAMGYRYFYGIGIAQSCENARKHYEIAANYAADQIQTRGYALHFDKSKLSDLHTPPKSIGRKEIDEEVVDYYMHLAEEGDAFAAVTVGNMLLLGSRFVEQDYETALRYLEMAADGKNIAASGLLSYIGVQKLPNLKMSVRCTEERILELALYASSRGDANGLMTMGYAYLKGFGGTTANVTRAMSTFDVLAGKHPDAGFVAGEILMGKLKPPPDSSLQIKLDVTMATMYYSMAAAKGNLLATHRLGHLARFNTGAAKSCENAVSSFRQVAERGDWMKQFSVASHAFYTNDRARSLIGYSRLAALGVETAQFNAAYILSRHYCPRFTTSSSIHSNVIDEVVQPTFSKTLKQISINSDKENTEESPQWLSTSAAVLDPIQWTVINRSISNIVYSTGTEQIPYADCELRALSLYELSAAQGNAESLLQIGDIHYYGKSGFRVNKADAAWFYQMAADLRHTHAIFNLGLMHEAGDGVEQDFHLAKRFFDEAAGMDFEARLPRNFALFLMQTHESMILLLGEDTVSKLLTTLQSITQTVWSHLSNFLLTITPSSRHATPASTSTSLRNLFSSKKTSSSSSSFAKSKTFKKPSPPQWFSKTPLEKIFTFQNSFKTYFSMFRLAFVSFLDWFSEVFIFGCLSVVAKAVTVLTGPGTGAGAGGPVLVDDISAQERTGMEIFAVIILAALVFYLVDLRQYRRLLRVQRQRPRGNNNIVNNVANQQQ